MKHQIPTRRTFCTASAAALAGGAWSQSYPGKLVKLIAPYQADGSTDVLARIVAESMSKRMTQSVVVDKQPDANGLLSSEAVRRASADGYTPVAEVGSTRAPMLLEVSIFKLQGFAGMESVGFFGISGPAGLRAAVVTTLSRVITHAMREPEMMRKVDDLGAVAQGGRARPNWRRQYKRAMTAGVRSSRPKHPGRLGCLEISVQRKR